MDMIDIAIGGGLLLVGAVATLLAAWVVSAVAYGVFRLVGASDDACCLAAFVACVLLVLGVVVVAVLAALAGVGI